jgi:hypothetical protein
MNLSIIVESNEHPTPEMFTEPFTALAFSAKEYADAEVEHELSISSDDRDYTTLLRWAAHVVEGEGSTSFPLPQGTSHARITRRLVPR